MDYKKVDFHTHSNDSHDGGISFEQYRQILESGQLDCVAITDHNKIRIAQQLHEEFGDKVIVGEEILAEEGEVIGLFLTKPIPSGLSMKKTIRLIKEQGAIVYIPHPFETIRHGIDEATLVQNRDAVDIIETCNGRAFLQNRSEKTVVWARLNHIPGAASSDAHGIRGVGKTYTLLREMPTKDTLLSLMSSAKLITDRPSLVSLLYPKYHRLRKRLTRA